MRSAARSWAVEGRSPRVGGIEFPDLQQQVFGEHHRTRPPYRRADHDHPRRLARDQYEHIAAGMRLLR
jgi:hypothetical protein